MFTNDNKMILKSMNTKDFYVFNEMKNEYFNYMENNQTFIAKIYGIFRFQFKDNEERYETVMVLRNIAGNINFYKNLIIKNKL